MSVGSCCKGYSFLIFLILGVVFLLGSVGLDLLISSKIRDQLSQVRSLSFVSFNFLCLCNLSATWVVTKNFVHFSRMIASFDSYVRLTRRISSGILRFNAFADVMKLLTSRDGRPETDQPFPVTQCNNSQTQSIIIIIAVQPCHATQLLLSFSWESLLRRKENVFLSTTTFSCGISSIHIHTIVLIDTSSHHGYLS